MFDLSRVDTVTGTVRVFEWTEPHAWLDLLITDQSGQSQVVAFQCLDPGVLQRHGWNRYSLLSGQRVQVSYYPERSGRPGGALRTVTLGNGTVLASYDFPPQAQRPAQ